MKYLYKLLINIGIAAVVSTSFINTTAAQCGTAEIAPWLEDFSNGSLLLVGKIYLQVRVQMLFGNLVASQAMELLQPLMDDLQVRMHGMMVQHRQ